MASLDRNLKDAGALLKQGDDGDLKMKWFWDAQGKEFVVSVESTKKSRGTPSRPRSVRGEGYGRTLRAALSNALDDMY